MGGLPCTAPIFGEWGFLGPSGETLVAAKGGALELRDGEGRVRWARPNGGLAEP